VEFVCSEVWGGNRLVEASVNLPGMTGWVYSKPCEGSHRGGDVHYLSTCGAGLMTRVLLADVVGHGEQVSQMSGWVHMLLRKHMSDPSPQRILDALNRQATSAGFKAMTTAALASYYAPSGRLLFGYAGHPPAMIYRAANDTWSKLELDPQRPQSGDRSPGEILFNIPLGVEADAAFDVGDVTLEPGDRLVFFSDGVLETPARADGFFADHGLARVLHEHRQQPASSLGPSLISALHHFASREVLTHDDVTLIVLDVGKRVGGSKMLHLVRNQIRRLFSRRAS
jgi:serine phosphatase RsbU (regulator of sigma subunit)